MRSRDGGQTWGEWQIIRANADTDERDVSIAQLRDGTLLVNNWPNDFYDGEGRYLQRAGDPTYRGKKAGIYFGRSTDNGHTWTWTEEPINPAPFTWLGSSERILELPSGRLLMACYNWAKEGTEWGSALFCSDDKGHTWRHLATPIDVPGMRLGEPALVQTRTGRLILMARNETPGGEYYQALSDDGGATWTPTRPSGVPGHRVPCSLLALPDGTVLCIYASRADPSGIYVVASHDDGATWDMARRRIIRDDFPNLDCGYPSAVLLPDGRVFTVYYFNMFGRYFIGGSFFRWED